MYWIMYVIYIYEHIYYVLEDVCGAKYTVNLTCTRNCMWCYIIYNIMYNYIYIYIDPIIDKIVF